MRPGSIAKTSPVLAQPHSTLLLLSHQYHLEGGSNELGTGQQEEKPNSKSNQEIGERRTEGKLRINKIK